MVEHIQLSGVFLVKSLPHLLMDLHCHFQAKVRSFLHVPESSFSQKLSVLDTSFILAEVELVGLTMKSLLFLRDFHIDARLPFIFSKSFPI